MNYLTQNLLSAYYRPDLTSPVRVLSFSNVVELHHICITAGNQTGRFLLEWDGPGAVQYITYGAGTGTTLVSNSVVIGIAANNTLNDCKIVSGVLCQTLTVTCQLVSGTDPYFTIFYKRLFE